MEECKKCDKAIECDGIYICDAVKPHLCKYVVDSDKKTVIVVIGCVNNVKALAGKVAEAHIEHNIIITTRPVAHLTRPIRNLSVESIHEYKNYHNMDLPELRINFGDAKGKRSWENPNKFHN